MIYFYTFKYFMCILVKGIINTSKYIIVKTKKMYNFLINCVITNIEK